MREQISGRRWELLSLANECLVILARVAAAIGGPEGVCAGHTHILSLRCQVDHHAFESIAAANQQMIVETFRATHDDFPLSDSYRATDESSR
jgi:hypothetical protein